MADLHMDDELRVAQTTPQGSQADAVDTGHEERDANVGAIMKWLIGTGVFVAVTLVALLGVYRVLSHANEGRVQLALIEEQGGGRQGPPVRPYIEGLVVGAGIDSKSDIQAKDLDSSKRAGMTEHLADVREREIRQLNSWGLAVPAPEVNDPHADVPEGEHHEDPAAEAPSQRPGEVSAIITDEMVKEVSAEDPKGVPAAKTEEIFSRGSQMDSTGGLYDLPQGWGLERADRGALSEQAEHAGNAEISGHPEGSGHAGH